MKIFQKLVVIGMALAGPSFAFAQIKECTLMTAEEGWDIYQAGTYRYGPSFIVNDDGSIDGWFAASGGAYTTDIYGALYNGTGTTSPVNISSQGSVAQKFTVDHDFYSFSVCCPTWGKTGQSMTLKVYRWRISYSSTLRTEPVYTKEITNMTDNGWIRGYASETAETDHTTKFEAGTYLWVMSDASETAGVWLCSKKAAAYSSAQAYQGTRVVGGVYEMILQDEYGQDVVTHFWDQISYQHSEDGGVTWTPEKMVLQPTSGSRDQLSACDPGVARWGDYYYLGYTSTEDNRGTDNHVYVARSKNPDGPWEKWNGEGWGGSRPQPVITYDGNPDNFGAGEPCMVVKDGLLYFYYSWNDGGTQTRVATTLADDENWPASLRKRGVAVNRSSMAAADHCDIKYCDAIDRFIAVHTASRMSADAYIGVWQSRNGINFNYLGRLKGPLKPGLHNCGITGTADGHLDVARRSFIAYAYGIGTWGQWNTMLNPLKFDDEQTGIEALVLGAEEDGSQQTVYDLTGRPVQHPQKGVYIVNHKKVLYK